MSSQSQGTMPGAIQFYGGYQVYSDTGVDLTLLRRNLYLSVEERLRSACVGSMLLAEVDKNRQQADSPGLPMGRKRPMLDAPALLRHLTEQNVDFIVIGGLAMIAQGSAYLTIDADICYSRDPKNIAALAAAFLPLHPYLRGAPADLPFQFDPPTIEAGLNFTLTTDLGDVDVLGEVSGIGGYDQVFARSEENTMFGLKLRVLSLEGLIVAKKAAGRTKDKLHLLELEELKKMRDAQS